MTCNNRAKTRVTFLIGSALMAIAVTGSAQDAMFVDSTGNVGVGTNTPGAPLHILRSDGTGRILLEDTGADASLAMIKIEKSGFPSIHLQDASQTDVNWKYRILGTQESNERFSVSKLGSGASEMELFHNGDLEILGTLSQGSSRSMKDRISPIHGEAVLEKLESLSISEWSYSSELEERHVGPMAEDFYAIFGLGPDNKQIAPGDLAGVALAAAKALQIETEEKNRRIGELQREAERKGQQIETLKVTLDRAMARIDALEARVIRD